MPSIRVSTTLAAGASDTNILSGSKFEFMPAAGAVLVYAKHQNDVTAATPLAVEEDVTFGNVIEGDALLVPFTPTPGDGPDTDKDLIASGVAAAGDRLVIKATNGGAEQATVRTLIKINYL